MENESKAEPRGVLLIVVDDPVPGKAGGTQLLARSLNETTMHSDVDCTVTETNGVLPLLLAPSSRKKIVFVQIAGRLSPEFKSLALSWIAAGAQVVEQNIFALPSKFRPADLNYHLALMSTDGAHRFSWRSAIARRPVPANYLQLPNPSYHQVETRAPSQNDALTLLRVGRPDPIKWSKFEEEFCISLVDSGGLGSKPVRLLRVGHPDAPNRTRHGSLTIEDLPYSPDVSHYFATADIYLHHSRIGETFGNTVAEAVRSGLPVILGQDLATDSAAVGLLDPQNDLYGTPAGLIKNAADAVMALQTGRAVRDRPGSPDVNLSPVQFLERLVTVGESTTHRGWTAPMPKARDFLGHLRSLRKGMFDHPPLGPTIALAVESLRSVKNRRKVD